MNKDDKIKVTWPDANKIRCKDCKNRDKTVVTVLGKEKPVGITKGFCEKYEFKPSEILFQNSECEFYEKE